MEKALKMFFIFVTIFVLVITVIPICKYYNTLEISQLRSSSMEYGSITDEEKSENSYEMHYIKYNSESEFLNTRINEFIDSSINSFIEENSTHGFMFKKDKAVFLQTLDTYKVNDDIVGIKIKTKVKKLKNNEYNTNIKTFNCSIKDKKDITLDELFKEGYKDKISDIYSDNYVLTNKEVIFFTNNNPNSCTYNNLKEYNCSTKLTMENLDVSEIEYKTLIPSEIDKNKKMIAITFDDGPHLENTDKVLDIFSKYNAKATFFMLGENVEKYPDVVKRVNDAGHEIGIHTWSHKELTKLSSEDIVNEVNKTANAIENITGKRPTLVRPPYGSVNDKVRNAINNPLILWNIDSLDWKSRDKNKIVPLVLNNIQDGDIVLLHDIHSTTVPAVEEIIKYLVENDYQIITVTEMLNSKGYDLTNTRVFYSARQ